MDSDSRAVTSREEFYATLAPAIRGDVGQRIARLEAVLREEPLHPGTVAYISEEIAVWRGHLADPGLDDAWWRTNVDHKSIGALWPDLDPLLHAGYSRDAAMEWITYGGIDYPAVAALEWRGYKPGEYVAWRRAVTSRQAADRWAARGWTAVQVREVVDALARRWAGTDDAEWGDPVGDEMESWVATGIPVHRVVLYTRIGIRIDEAERHEEEARGTGEDLDSRLSTLAALTDSPGRSRP